MSSRTRYGLPYILFIWCFGLGSWVLVLAQSASIQTRLIPDSAKYTFASLIYLLLTLICFFLRYDRKRSVDQASEDGVTLSAVLVLPKELAVAVIATAAILNTIVLLTDRSIRREVTGGWVASIGEVVFRGGLLAFTTLTGSTVYELFKIGKLSELSLLDLRTVLGISSAYVSILSISWAVSLTHEWFRGTPISIFLKELGRFRSLPVLLSEVAGILLGVAMAAVVDTNLSVYIILALILIALVTLLGSQEAINRRMQTAIVEMKLLNSLGRALSSTSQTRSQLVEAVEAKCKDLFAADQFAVHFTGEDSEVTLFMDGHEGSLEATKQLASWVAYHQTLLNLGDLRVQLAQYGIDPSGIAVNSWLGAPLEIEGRVLGVISIASAAKYAFDEQHAELMEALSRQFVSALENARLYEISTLDGLTGLINARTLRLKLAELFSEAAASGKPIAVIMLDIDHFKRINDTYGHEAGNDVLQHLSKLLKDQTRDGDISARYGGEEFTVVLPGAHLELALKVASRLRAAIEGSIMETCEGNLKVTSSLGVASYPEINATDHNELISLADKALYRSKQNGRNRVTSAKDI